MTVTIEKVGRRYYATGNTFAIKDTLKAKGFKWDSERRAWYTGKKDVAEALDGKDVGNGDGGNNSGDGDKQIVAGKAEYKGRTYYLAGRVNRGKTAYDRDEVEPIYTRDAAKTLLVFRDGSKTFWAARDAIRVVKSYRSPQTIGGLKDFADREKKADANNEPRCAECGGRGQLVQDMEDGMLKHYSCCDMPPTR